jgi:hypothetical protein
MKNSELTNLLKNIENEKSYFVGGTLCIDKDNDVITLCLNETFGYFSGGYRKLLDTVNTKLLFNIYKKFKGETNHYTESLEKSHIRHIY